MINNRQNGRRRGRGGGAPRPNGGNNGPDRGNRIDNRARGNANQLHEKYKTLARDAQMQGDRVMTEYYLQFADHYFRVLNENRSRLEEQRRDRFDNQDFDDDSDGDFNGAGEFGGEETGGERNGNGYTSQNANGQGERRARQDRYERQDRPERQRFERQDRAEPAPQLDFAEPVTPAGQASFEPQPGVEGVEIAPRARRTRGRPRRDAEGAEGERIDAASLPPAFAAEPQQGPAPASEPIAETAADGEEKPKRRRGRPRKDESATVTAEA